MFILPLVIDGWIVASEIVLRWMSLALTDDKSTLVHLMAWNARQQAIIWTRSDPDLWCDMASLA